MNKFAERFKELRLDKKLSQQEVAKQFRVTQRCVCGWEKYKRQPEYDLLIEIAQFFGVSTDYLLGLED